MKWINHCDKAVTEALRFLAGNRRPAGGQEQFNAEHLLQIAQEFELSLKVPNVDAGSPDDIRAAGWAVAVHNDYRLKGENHTFWLFVKGGRAVKGEGKTDAEALCQIRERLRQEQSAVALLEFYGAHKGECPGQNPNQGCSCGLREAIAKFNTLVA